LDDPTLLEVWMRLYNDTTPVALWGDKMVTGRELAKFLREAGISLVAPLCAQRAITCQERA
jgi:hypothetical protein